MTEQNVTWAERSVRRAIASAQTIVVKVGSSSLTQPSGHLDCAKLQALVGALARVENLGARIVLVSSGAVAAGFGPLGFDERPFDAVSRQASAAVGQVVLMGQYEAEFACFGLNVGQVLMSTQDTMRSSRYRNVRNTINRLLDLGVVPIVNENDTLVTTEVNLRFGDNDRLAALVANIVRADALVLLSDVDALYTAPPTEPGAKRISFVKDVLDLESDIQVGESGSNVGTGGMITKLDSARIATASGIPCLLTSSTNAGPSLMGDPVGTVFAPVKSRETSRRLWIGYASNPRGTLIVDQGASKVIREGKASLLAAGTIGYDGDFSAGDPVWIDDENGKHLAKGLVGFDSDELVQILGRTTNQLQRFLGAEYAHPLVHRDDLVLI